MELKKLDIIPVLDLVNIVNDGPETITGVTSDSRQVKPGFLFVAIKGTQVDGFDFIDAAIKAGAVLIVTDRLPQTTVSGITYFLVRDAAEAMGQIASLWWGQPSEKLKLVGVTGTNGKTTTATLIYEMARLMGYKAGLLSTVANYIEDEKIHATHTTPDPMELNELLAKMVNAGCQYAAMEVSSHAADQKRIAGLTFAGGIFTNLTRDHLDYHKTFENYLKAKQSFFDRLPKAAWALTNIDDRNGLIMIQNTAARRHTYSLRSEADYRGQILESRIDGTLMSFNGHEVHTMFTGRFNAYNLTAVYGACHLLGWHNDTILVNMSRLVPVAGRFQALHSPKGFTAIVDYAHTPDAVVNVIEAIREVVGPDGEIITVVGAGGNRDKGKRPIMAREAAARSERVILTSDNPRFEVPEEIIHDMEAGLDDEARGKTLSITDRREAIRTACALAQKGSVVLVAGKGHEDYQEIKGVKHHFDDREVLLSIFKEI